ncbi:MAG: acetolactate synthase small subunit [Lutibacter sp.]|nr:acetolactate synthase small subunit [Lutibacter sp.]
MEEKQVYTVSVYTENNIGILNRLSAIFLKRHINIESMTVSESEIDHVHRFTFVVIVTETLIRKVVLQLEKQIEVIGAFFHTEDEIIYHEIALFKVSSEHLYDENIQNKLRLRRAHIIAITERYFVIEASGLKEDIDNMYQKLKPYGLMQFVRSGCIAISRPRMAISDVLKEIAPSL